MIWSQSWCHQWIEAWTHSPTVLHISSPHRLAIGVSHAPSLIMLLSAMFCLGSSFVAAKFVVASFPKFLALEFRVGLTAIILAPYLLSGKLRLPRIDASISRLLFLQALFGIVAFNVFFFYSLTHTSAAMAGIVYGTLPMIIAFFAHFMLGETLSLRTFVGIALASLGIILAAGDPRGSSEPALSVGTVLLLGAVACAALFTIIGKRLSAVLAPISLAALLNLFAAVIILPLAAVEALSFPVGLISLRDWGALAFWASSSGVFSGLASRNGRHAGRRRDQSAHQGARG